VYQTRLGSGTTGFSASGVAADGKLYYTSEEGDAYVVKAGPQFQLLATNSMGEVCMATPAISEGVLYFRTQAHLVAIREK
jgi:outer membrane protein assembly factor BamB